MDATHKVIIGCTVGACIFAYGLFELLPQYRLSKLKTAISLNSEKILMQNQYDTCVRDAGEYTGICRDLFDLGYSLCEADKTNKVLKENHGFLPSTCEVFKVRK